MINPFEVLGLKGWATPDEIRTAYRSLVKQVHPDLIQDPKPRTQRKWKLSLSLMLFASTLELIHQITLLATSPDGVPVRKPKS